MEIQRIEKLRDALAAKRKKFSAGVERGLKLAGLFLLRESMKIVPIDTSALKNSGPAVTRSEPAEGGGFQTVMTVGYGTFYAVYVHENLMARHAPGKFAKFLETPLNENRRYLIDIVRGEAGKG